MIAITHTAEVHIRDSYSYETGHLTRFYLDGISLVDTMQDRKGDFTLDELIQETGDHGRGKYICLEMYFNAA
jgi:hypothetical protein